MKMVGKDKESGSNSKWNRNHCSLSCLDCSLFLFFFCGDAFFRFTVIFTSSEKYIEFFDLVGSFRGEKFSLLFRRCTVFEFPRTRQHALNARKVRVNSTINTNA